MSKIKSQTYLLLITWLLTLLSTLITLYLSEILQESVCSLCWYQRIGIYPLAVILGIALYRDDQKIYIYALPLASIAAFFALYQYLLQMIPGFNPIHFCTTDLAHPSCSEIGWKVGGFITLPLLSFFNSLIIIGLLIVIMIKDYKCES